MTPGVAMFVLSPRFTYLDEGNGPVRQTFVSRRLEFPWRPCSPPLVRDESRVALLVVLRARARP